MNQQPADLRPRVVIVGGGFGGMEIAQRLRKSDVRVYLLDRHNYNLFQPLLYQVATGALSPANIATPLRAVLGRQKNCEVLLAEATGLDIAAQRLELADGHIDYDYLIFAAGAATSYFGNDSWQKHAPGLKTIIDATNIRRRIYLAFEAAERQPNAAIRQQLLTFVVVGGGPTGVELAGALVEIAENTLKNDFRHINPAESRIVLVEASPHLLSHYPSELCARVEKKIRSMGIEVQTRMKVTDIGDGYVCLQDMESGEDSRIESETVLWAAGVRANPLGQIIAAVCGVEADRMGRVPVTSGLSIKGHDNVFVIGDLANCTGEGGKPLPGLAPVAIQQGRFLAKRIDRRVAGKPEDKEFKYKDRGTMAAIGRAAAVAQIGKHQFVGFFAWILWLFVHLMLITQFHNRLLVLIQWGWNYLTFGRSARLITGEDMPKIVRQSDTINPQQATLPSKMNG